MEARAAAGDKRRSALEKAREKAVSRLADHPDAKEKRILVCGVRTPTISPKTPQLLQHSTDKAIADFLHHAHPLLQVPIVVICTHFDAVQQREPEELKALAKSLRALCHMHNASIVFLSTADRARCSLTCDVSRAAFQIQPISAVWH